MKKHTNIKLKLRLEKQTVRELTDSDYRAVVGGSSVVGDSSIVYTCDTTTSGAQSGQPTVGCPA